jgi:hypothetical protein
MAYKDLEEKRQRDREYRERNREVISEKRRAAYHANREKILVAQKERYERNKESILARQREYHRRRVELLGYSPSTEHSRKWRERNREKCNQRSRENAAKYYRADPMRAAIKRAKNILSQQTGVLMKDLDPALVEAKALQILVRATALHPNRAVGQTMTDAERKQRKAEQWKKWADKNRDYLRARDSERRARTARQRSDIKRVGE